MLHTLEGIVRADVRRVDYDDETGRFEEEVRWHDSYEAEQHVHHYGKSSAPVCWSLVGYPAGSSARVSERRSTFARSAARDRESDTAPRSGGM